jgi:hypothetical protein
MGCGLIQQNSVQYGEELLCDLLRVAGNCEDPRAIPKVSVWTRAPLYLDLAAEL